MDYLLKVSALIGLFYLAYILLLQRETFFQLNRWFLLLGIPFAFCLPFVVIPIYVAYTPSSIPNLVVTEAAVNDISISQYNLFDYLNIIYGLGVLFFSLRFLLQLISVLKFLTQHKSYRKSTYSYIETNQNISPFSFFKWIAFPKNAFNENELSQILAHEKIHAKQLHSFDVLLTQLSCIILWFNPFIWLYAKSVKQNLEFIADEQALKHISNKKAYAYTLLKTNMPTHQTALSNHFFNSLIKKRIIMLNKSQSKKINQLKSLLLIPVIAGFLMSFNTKEVFIENESSGESYRSIQQTLIDSNEIQIEFNKYLTNAELESIKQQLKQKGIEFSYSNLQRNANSEISSIYAKFKMETGSTTWNDSNEKGIGVFYFFKSEESFGVSRLNTRNPIYILDGKEISEEELNKINPQNIVSVTVFKDEKAIEKYGDKGKNGVVVMVSKKTSNNQSKNQWTVSKERNKNVVFATKDTIYVNNKPNILIETIHSFEKEPLILLDGKESSKAKIIQLNEGSIQSISTIKGGEKAIELYGNKATNGVVLIKTGTKTTRPFVKKLDANLYIVNGKEVKKEEFEKIEPQNIKGINVLKDKKAIEKYGEKGKNGVLEVTLK